MFLKDSEKGDEHTKQCGRPHFVLHRETIREIKK